MPENSLLSRALLWSSEMAQRVKAFVPEPADLDSIPRTYMMQEENLLQAALWFLHLGFFTQDPKQVFLKTIS